MSKKEENYAAELWKEKKREAGVRKAKRKAIYGNRQDEKKPGDLLTDATKKG
jgi:hypothetical protein